MGKIRNPRAAGKLNLRGWRAPRSEQGQLRALERLGRGGFLAFARGGDDRFLGDLRFAVGVELGQLQVAQNLLGARDDLRRQPGQPRDLDAVTLVRAALDDLAQEDDLVVPLAHGDVVILDAGPGHLEFGEFVVMGGEERPRADAVVQVFRDAPRDGQAVEGRGAAADLVQDDEAALGGVVEDVGGLVHLDHEGRLPAREVVAGADAGEDAVGEANLGALAGRYCRSAP